MRLLLEGPSIAEVLARVTADYGPAARIVKADKVRTGGVGGFFARERYEVTVEVDVDADVPSEAAQPAATAAQPGRLPVRRPLAPAAVAPVTAPLTPPAAPAAPAPAAPLPAHVDLASAALPAHAAPTHEALPTPTTPFAGRTLSTQTPAFAEVLASLTRDRTVLSGTGPDPAASEDVPALPTQRRPEPPVTPAPVPTSAPTPAFAPTPAAVRVEAVGGRRPGRAGSARQLVDLGVPASLVDAVVARSGGDARTARADELVTALARHLAAPGVAPRRAGDVTVVLGSGQEALQAAHGLAGELGAAYGSVPVQVVHEQPSGAGRGRRLAGTEDLGERTRTWRGATTPTVVVVEVSPHPRAEELCRLALTLAQVRPARVVAVHDVTRRTRDAVRHLTALANAAATTGGLDGIAATGLEDAVEPGAVVEVAQAAALPIRLLDGRPATTGAWVDVLGEALGEPDDVDRSGDADPLDGLVPGRTP